MTPAAGYSGTPLGRKLGYGGRAPVRAPGMPADMRGTIEQSGPVDWAGGAGAVDAPLFVTEAATMARLLAEAKQASQETGMIRVSWPTRAAKIETDITEDRIRDTALPLGPVDVKVCAADAVRSGLKLMLRKELRTGASTMARTETEVPDG